MKELGLIYHMCNSKTQRGYKNLHARKEQRLRTQQNRTHPAAPSVTEANLGLQMFPVLLQYIDSVKDDMSFKQFLSLLQTQVQRMSSSSVRTTETHRKY